MHLHDAVTDRETVDQLTDLNILKCFLGLIVTLKLEASCSAKLTSPGLKFAQMLNYSSSVHAELPAALASSEATAALCFSGISH